MLFVFLVSLFACKKDKDDDKLPRRLRDMIEHTTCVHDPVLVKCLYAGNVIFVMSWTEPMSEQAPVFYDKDGKQISSSLGPGTLQVVETVWKCKP